MRLRLHFYSSPEIAGIELQCLVLQCLNENRKHPDMYYYSVPYVFCVGVIYQCYVKYWGNAFTHSLTHCCVQIGLANCVFHRFGFCSGHCDALYRRRQRDSFPTCIQWIHANQVSSDYINTEPCMHGIYLCGSPIFRRFFHCCGSFMFHNRTRVAFFWHWPGMATLIIQLYGSIHPMQLQLTGLRNNAVR